MVGQCQLAYLLGKAANVWKHSQSDFGSNGLGESAGLLPRLLLLGRGQFPALLLGEPDDVIRSEVRPVMLGVRRLGRWTRVSVECVHCGRYEQVQFPGSRDVTVERVPSRAMTLPFRHGDGSRHRYYYYQPFPKSLHDHLSPRCMHAAQVHQDQRRVAHL